MKLLNMAKELLAELAKQSEGSVTPEGGMLVQAFVTNHTLIAIAEQLARNNNILTDVGVANGWWKVEDRLEHAIRKQQEDK